MSIDMRYEAETYRSHEAVIAFAVFSKNQLEVY